MKISMIKVSNFLKLREIDLKPNDTNIIVGKNRQGKTSILKAIEAAMGGKVDSSCIRTGENSAEIMLELDDITVKRTITQKDTYLDVSNKEGMKMPKPQKYLDGLIGSFSFNPVDFFNMKPADQKKYLLEAMDMKISWEQMQELVGAPVPQGIIDYSAHALEVVSQVHKIFYDQRTVTNAEVTKKRKTIDEMSAKLPEGFDAKEVSVEKIDELRETIRVNELDREKEVANDGMIQRLIQEGEDLNKQIAALEEKRNKLRAEVVEKKAIVFDTCDDLVMASAKETLEKLEGQRDLVHTAESIENMKSEMSEHVTQQQTLDAIVKKLKKEIPEQMIKNANLPIKGLSVTEDGLTMNGIALENMSTSEQIRFALDVVRAMNSKFKVILIDGIECLDKESFDTFIEEVKEDDYQYFVTRVDGSGEGNISIIDGEVQTNKGNTDTDQNA